MYTIILHTTYYNNHSDYRNEELLRAFNLNLNLNVVFSIYVFTECELPMSHPKLIKIKINERPNFRMLSSHFDDNAVNIICNSDISFTKDLSRIFNILNHPDKVCFLSRRVGLGVLGKWIVFKHNTGNSQDAWAFFGKIPENTLLKKLGKIEIGVPGNDNALVYLFKQFNYEVLNPSYAITLLHHHKSENRNYSESDRLKLKYDYVKPLMSLNNNLIEFIIMVINRIYHGKWFR